ncbi:MAG: pyruvate formate lyase-activating protein [Ruminococcaceae bacterium]|nr:pyruvate formate lyase-activating protein [Oscillospiraceae bacterium]
MKGFVNSIQTLGTLDGPGVRFVVFMQGCNLRCGYCHNPETWEASGGTEYLPQELCDKAVRFKTYFGHDGGITLSGGEPLLQAEFAKELFVLCHEKGINTCIDTSGNFLSDNVKELLNHTDRVLLDIKFTDDELYKKHIGCTMFGPLEFLKYVNEINVPVTIRQVIVPSLNDTSENILKLAEIINAHPCVDSFELLPFKKICSSKYEKKGLEFKFKDLPQPDEITMKKLNDLLHEKTKK